ncbi:CPBP family intramembrane metalloprotease [Ktedonosporobacter rubrisoli]|uniref:CPBP family intramembrane metalloprotease n=1 Tax=Ktedonosporobacter rubrisoli TaxID=2509675 RepID=A0A4V0YY41_KTERU|nr:type II CAAX endopeptidase family protein [Ktedonosporobacter rubrisoli]QBD74901.1 CPBP family intramembrane metalloprotease [Ktedonosporobacter rubrisoli]
MASKNVKIQTGQHYDHRSILRGHTLVAYFVLAYLISWLLWLPFVVSKGGGTGLLPFTMAASGLDTLGIIILGSFGPAIAAWIVSVIVEGKVGVRLLLRRMIRVRAGIQWYILALFLPLLACVLYYLPFGPQEWPGHLFSTKGAFGLALYVVYVLSGMLAGSPLGEEPGWRGFALYRLQKRMGPLPGSLLLALLWACWHLPLLVFTVWGSAYQQVGLLPGLAIYILTVASYTIVMTWLFNNTRGSIFLAILFHSAVDTAPSFLLSWFPELGKMLQGIENSGLAVLMMLAGAGVWLVIAGIILLATRGKLSYKPELENDVRPVIAEPAAESETAVSN